MGKATCEAALSLDINYLLRSGYLRHGAQTTLRWTRNGEPIGSIGVGCNAAGALALRYSVNGVVVNYTLDVSWTDCRYGGSRPWFICPNCKRRKAKLYMVDRYFVCRGCGGLCYDAQLEKYIDRGFSIAHKLIRRLGGEWTDDVLPKPKGMHWRTYHKICARVDTAKNRVWGRLFERY